MLSQKEFDEIQKGIFLARGQGNFSEAFALIERGINEGDIEMKGISLFYRGMFLHDQGAVSDAMTDWIKGLTYAGPGTFLRYELECHVGDACEQLGETPEAVKWFRSALQTCFNGGEFSGRLALTAFARLHSKHIASEDHELVASVLTKSWRVHELLGSPNTKDLPGAIAALAEGFANLEARIINEDS